MAVMKCYLQGPVSLMGGESDSVSAGLLARTSGSECLLETSLQSPAMRKTTEMTAK